MKELYIEPLVYPHRSLPPSQPNSPKIPSHVTDHPNESSGESELPSASSASASMSIDHLPIAARFLTTDRPAFDSRDSNESTPKTDQESWVHGEGSTSTQQLPEIIGESNTPRLDSNTSSLNSANPRFRSHHSLPAQPRPGTAGRSDSENDSRSRPSASEPHHIRHYLKGRAAPQPKKLHRPRVNMPAASLLPGPLPEALRIVLEVIGNDMLKGHDALSIRLKDRYQEQYPLVRSLTDVWADQVRSRVSFM
jgi:hypothetical protein